MKRVPFQNQKYGELAVVLRIKIYRSTIDHINHYVTSRKKESRRFYNIQIFYCRGGFRVIPEMIEFWQGQTTRIHDRIRFRKPKTDETIDKKLTHEGEDGWVYERLAP